MDDYITKPLRKNDLLDMAGKWLDPKARGRKGGVNGRLDRAL